MKKLVYVLCLATIPALLILSAGCGGAPEKKKRKESAETKESDDTKEAKGNSSDDDTKTPVKSSGWATLKGTIVYDGDPPEKISTMDMTPDTPICHAKDATDEEKSQQRWIVHPENKGVANVVVYLKAPADKYFKISSEQLAEAKKTPVYLDQPHCAYIPHIVTLFPEYYNPEEKDTASTKQQFIVKNSAPAQHDTTFSTDPVKKRTLAANKNEAWPVNTPDNDPLKPQNQPYDISCNFHKFMKGYVWSFDHPYATISKGFPYMEGKTPKEVPAKEWGTFELKVPADAKVRLVIWHEVIHNVNGANGELITTPKDGETKNLGKIKIKAKS